MAAETKTDLAALYRDALEAIRDALSVPLPGTANSDRVLYERIQHDRVIAVHAAVESVLAEDANPIVIASSVEWLRTRVDQLPIIYRRYIPEAADYPPGCVVCGPGCCSPVLGVHTSCPGPMVGRTVESVR